jgi:hypothetical protein
LSLEVKRYLTRRLYLKTQTSYLDLAYQFVKIQIQVENVVKMKLDHFLQLATSLPI